jgi:prepilin peptidase CpaA
VCLWLLWVAVSSDLLWRRIPNALTLPAAGFGVWYHAGSAPDALGMAGALTGMFAGGALLLILYPRGGVGGGDVKLLAALGAWLGAEAAAGVFVYGALVGFVYAAWLLRRRKRDTRVRENGIPYSVPLALGFTFWHLVGVPW